MAELNLSALRDREDLRDLRNRSVSLRRGVTSNTEALQALALTVRTMGDENVKLKRAVRESQEIIGALREALDTLTAELGALQTAWRVLTETLPCQTGECPRKGT